MDFVTAADCQRLLTLDDVVAGVKQALVWEQEGQVTWPEPRNLNIIGDVAGNHYHVKACVLEPIPVAGMRLVSHPGDDDSGGGTRLIVLIDPATTKPIAMVDESWNYGQRTVASVVVAGAAVAKPDVRTIAIVGTGHLAKLALTYVQHLFPSCEEVRATSRSAERRAAFVAWAADELGLAVRATETVGEAVAGADVIITCTSAGRPLIAEGDLGAGGVVIALDPVEVAPELVAAADHVFVDSREQLRKELIACWGEGAPDAVSGTFADLLTGAHPGRANPEQRVVIVSQGLASQDVALAHLAYSRSRDRTSVG